MIIQRTFWQQKIEHAWQEKNIIWLMGVRRAGKTSLCQSLDSVEYFDCEKPRTRLLLADPELFLESNQNKRIVLDEIHRLDNPSEILKIAADYYPTTKIIATGSSTLGASMKFKDTLAGRKREIWLTPLLLEELPLFGNKDLPHRFLYGGLPSFFNAVTYPEKDFQEWIDAFWAKDIQDMFKVMKRYSFQKFVELLFAQSGGIFEATKFTIPCEVTRQTIANYLAILEETLIAHVIRPFSTHKATEIVAAPKVYAFDTGFTAYAKGWKELRHEDFGLLWESCVLNEIQGALQTRSLQYWRDKRGHEIDFVFAHGDEIVAIECKYSSLMLQDQKTIPSIRNFEAFRALYKNGKNFIVASDITQSFTKKYQELGVHFVSPKELITLLQSEKQSRG